MTGGRRSLCLWLVAAVFLSGTVAALADRAASASLSNPCRDGEAVANLTTDSSLPTVETHDPYTLGPSTATLEGFLTNMGTAGAVDLSFEWGTDTSYGNSTAPMTTVGCPMYFYAELTGLTPGTEYHYRAVAIGDGTAYGDDVAFTAMMPPTVTTSAATAVSTTMATLNGNLISLGTDWFAIVCFEWGPTTSYGQQTWAEQATATGAFSAMLTGLTASTVYHVRAKAWSGHGSSYGDDMTFTTSAFGIPEVVTIGQSPPPVTATSAILDGNLVSLGSASSVTVSFVWGTTPGGPYPDETTGEVRMAIGYFDYKLSNLTPGTTYHYKAKVAGDGTSYGAERSYTTTYPATPPSVTTGSADDTGITKARISGEVTSLGSAHDVSVYFEWGLTTSYGNTTAPGSRYSPGSLYASLAGLTPDTTYHFRAVAVGDGTGYGEDKSFTTPAIIPPSVSTNAATSITSASARLNGDLSALGTAATVYVSFEYGTVSGSYTDESAPQLRTSAGPVVADASDLSPGTTYYYRAKAVSHEHGTAHGDEASFTTNAAPPQSNRLAVIVLIVGILLATGTAILIAVLVLRRRAYLPVKVEREGTIPDVGTGPQATVQPRAAPTPALSRASSQVSEAPARVYCPKCGNQSEGTPAFCRVCGYALVGALAAGADGGRFKSAHAIATVLVVAFFLVIVTDAIAAFIDVQRIDLLNRIISGGGYTLQEAEASDSAFAAVGIAQLIIFIVTAILFLIWIHRASKNLRPLGSQGQKYSPRWAVGGFFVPFANWVLPFLATKEIWKGSAPKPMSSQSWRSMRASLIVPAWWVLYTVSSILANVIGRMALRGGETATELLNESWVWLISDLVEIPAAILAILVVWGITSRQDEKNRRLLGAVSAPSAPYGRGVTPTAPSDE